MSCPSSVRRRDSNPRPLYREPPPITTRPGLPPKSGNSYLTVKIESATRCTNKLMMLDSTTSISYYLHDVIFVGATTKLLNLPLTLMYCSCQHYFYRLPTSINTFEAPVAKK